MRSARNEWVWLVLSMAVFSIVAFWIIVRSSDTEEIQPAFSTYTAQPRGCRALFELLNRAGFSATRYGGTEYNLPADTCLVLAADSTVDATSFTLMLLDTKAVQLWVEQGGVLVLITDPHSMLASDLSVDLDEASLFDPSAPAEEYPPPVQIAADAGNGEPGSEMAFTREYQPGKRFSLESPRSLIWENIDEIEIAETGYSARQLQHALLVTQPLGQPIVNYEPRGEGAVYWLAAPEMTTNLWIDRADNHRLLLSLFGMAAGTREIIFFEKIHGYTEQRHNVGSLLVQTNGGRLLLALGLCCVLAFAPLAVRPARMAASPVPPRRHTAEMVYAQADLYARAGKYHLAAGLLVNRLISRLEGAGVIRQGAGRHGLKELLAESRGMEERSKGIVHMVLEGERIGSAAEFSRLARECDKIFDRITEDESRGRRG